jgi:hypothetical protein
MTHVAIHDALNAIDSRSEPYAFDGKTKRGTSPDVALLVLKRFFGTDHIGFDAAQENGLSRILVGFHFRKAVEEGIDHGSKIGEWAVDRYLRPERRRSDHDGYGGQAGGFLGARGVSER